MELKMEQASVCDPERLEQQQDKSRVGMHTERCVRWRSSDAGQIWLKERAWHGLGRKKGEQGAPRDRKAGMFQLVEGINAGSEGF